MSGRTASLEQDSNRPLSGESFLPMISVAEHALDGSPDFRVHRVDSAGRFITKTIVLPVLGRAVLDRAEDVIGDVRSQRPGHCRQNVFCECRDPRSNAVVSGVHVFSVSSSPGKQCVRVVNAKDTADRGRADVLGSPTGVKPALGAAGMIVPDSM